MFEFMESLTLLVLKCPYDNWLTLYLRNFYEEFILAKGQLYFTYFFKQYSLLKVVKFKI